MKKLTKQQLKNRELLAQEMIKPLKTKEQMEKESKVFQKKLKRMYG